MPFESLSFRHRFRISNFPDRWLSLIHLYDPDLPLFPVYYFHAVSNMLLPGQRPNLSDRIFGFVEKLNSVGPDTVEVFLVTNKDLSLSSNQMFKGLAENEVRERLGINNPVRYSDISNAFHSPLDQANPVLQEIWHRVVSNAYGNLLPFGKLWDEVMGLTRFVASWNSDKGRKGELIQTHYFCSKFGERIQTGGGIQDIDFFLLPTIHEVFDQTNPLNNFPNYSKLIEVSVLFQSNKCSLTTVGSLKLSRFLHTKGTGYFDTEKLLELFSGPVIPQHLQNSARECFNAFYKGPTRTVLFLLMLSDLRSGRLNPSQLSGSELGCIYDQLQGTYQSPKVIHIYAQQSFGNSNAIPVDIWITTFLKYPLNVGKTLPRQSKSQFLLSRSSNIGKVERLIWVAAQARKVHSSACNDALWCIKKASGDEERGANPLSCNICILRNACPAFQEIKTRTVVFNSPAASGQFRIDTSAGNNHTHNQTFVSCSGDSIYGPILDDFSPSDAPEKFASFPSQHHPGGRPLTVDDFINMY